MAFATLLAMSVLAAPDVFDVRAKDWRNGAIIYQVFPDRFVPPADPAAKKAYYASPRRFHDWSDVPKVGRPDGRYWSHELDFWGGDLPGILTKLDYVKGLGADVLYLTPIFKAYSNHKYDTTDYFQVDPGFGAQADLDRLTAAVHKEGMKIMLDGVFNHIGYTSPIFESASKDPQSKYAKWFSFGKQYRGGVKGFSPNMPTLKLENPAVRNYLWNGPNSVVRKRLREGIDGWRLDVAYNLGPEFLGELTAAAHAEKPGSEVVGEVSGYPAHWFPQLDGVFNFFAPQVVLQTLKGEISGGRAGTMLAHQVADAGIENTLKSWILLDNHDTPRVANLAPDLMTRQMLVALQFTLPGSPVIYYGSELGMKGTGDPENRAPMRWDLANKNNADLAWMRKIVEIRKKHPALRYGNFTVFDSDKLLAFARTTNKVRDTVLVVLNPTDQEVKETLGVRLGRLFSWGELDDALTGEQTRSITGLMTVTVKPKSVLILTPRTEGNDAYDRIP